MILVSLLAQTLKKQYCTYIYTVGTDGNRFDLSVHRLLVRITVLAVLLRAALLYVASYE
jgi:hypothetical protein